MQSFREYQELDEEERGLLSGVVVKEREGKLRVLDIEGKLPRHKNWSAVPGQPQSRMMRAAKEEDITYFFPSVHTPDWAFSGAASWSPS